MHLIYTPLALEDFDTILDRIAKDNPAAAVRLGEDFNKTCLLLKTNPRMGEAKDNLQPGLRRFICRGYGIYYRIDEERKVVYVSRFIHPRINVTSQLFR